MDPLFRTTNDFTPMMDGYAVTPNDSTDLNFGQPDPKKPTRGLLIGGAGTIKVDMAYGSTVTLTIPATACGTILYISVKRIYATGTTATNIVAFY